MQRFYKISITTFFFVLLASFLVSCDKENNSETKSCYCSDHVDSLYRSDAQMLLFKEIYENPEHEDRDNPYFDELKVQEFLKAIQAVYDLDFPEREEVFEENVIHVFPLYGLHSISIRTDTSSQEVKNLISGEPTGNTELDNIISKYKFNEVKTSYFYPDFNWITIIADEPLNLFPVIDELAVFPFFSNVEFGGGSVGDGNNITVERFEDNIILDFSIGWGDCPAGCIHRKHWQFSVDKNCNAVFLNSWSN